MSDVWTDLVTSNPVHSLLEELERSTDEALVLESLPETAVAYLRRIETVVTNIRERLTQMRPALVSVTSLNNAVPQLQNATALVRGFIGDRNEGQLQTANSHVDNLVTEFRWLVPLSHKAESRALLRASEAFAGIVDAREAQARQKLDSLVAAIDSATVRSSASVQQVIESMESLKASGEASVTSLTTKIEAAIAAQSTELSAQKTRLDAYFEQQQTAHLTTQQEWQREFSETMEQLKSGARLDFQIEIDQIQTAKKQFEAQSNQYIESLRKLEEEAQQITGVTAAAGVTGSYIKEAEQQRSTADLWRLGSVLFLLLTAAGALATSIWSPLNANVSPEEIAEYGLTRVPIVVVLGTITGYMAAQSAHHRNRERSARRRAMELTAFRPFIGELPSAEQHALIGETARKYFRADGDDAISAGPPKPS